MYYQTLNGAWQVSRKGSEDWLPAQVPGCIHTDLMESGVIPDPFIGDNELSVQWIAQADWIYRRAFIPNDELLRQEHIYLECDGLDTLASLKMNGKEIGCAKNMHRRYRFDVAGILHPGTNDLEIELTSPVNYASEHLKEYPLVISPSHSIPGSPLLRKAMYQWGWDWAPKLPTSGIWRPLKLVGYSTARIRDVHIRQKHSSEAVIISISTQVERFTSGTLVLSAHLTSPQGEITRQISELHEDDAQIQFEFCVKDPQLWWPNGYGAQPLYKLQIGFKHPRQESEYRTRIGLRTLELKQENDRWGKSFYFVVNNIPIFAKGANWVPADQFPSRLTTERYRRLISSAAQSNMNMLRIWGGGIYEDDRFYDLCDEYGILVWQDFMFSCAHYPATNEMLENIRQEASNNIQRIRHHPCLALWCGNNEIEWGHSDWWSEKIDERKIEYNRIFQNLLPEVCDDEDPDTPYWPSSPSSGIPFDAPNGSQAGDGHYWEVWHGKKPFTAYQEHIHRFISEFGCQSLPSMESIESFTEPEDRDIFFHAIELHQKQHTGNHLMLNYLTETFGTPDSLPKMVYLSQIHQAEAMRYGVEHWRRHRNNQRCMGTLYWQLNDCWPAVSWSSIEYPNRLKALHYAARRFFAPVLLSAKENDTKVKLHVTNDKIEPFIGKVRWSLEDLRGNKISYGEADAVIPAESSVCIAELDLSAQTSDANKHDLILIQSLWQHGKRISLGIVTFVQPKNLKLLNPGFAYQVFEHEGKANIELRSSNTALWVMLCIPGKNVRFSDNFFHLPAGENISISVEEACGMKANEIANELEITSLSTLLA